MEDEELEDVMCGTCNGSGEGMYDGSTCHACGGGGEVPHPDAPEPDYDDHDFAYDYHKDNPRDDYIA